MLLEARARGLKPFVGLRSRVPAAARLSANALPDVPWASVLGVPENDTATLLKMLADVIELVRKAKSSIVRLSDIDPPKIRVSAPAVQAFQDALQGEDEFVLLVARRMPNGRYGVIGAVPEDKSLAGRALRKFASSR